MSNNIDLKKGLDIPVSGTADLAVTKRVVPDIVAISPSDFKGFIPRLLVREGDNVLAGSPVMADKKNPDILLTSPVSGTVQEIVRGEKRKLLAVVIKYDIHQEFLDFGIRDAASLTADEVKSALLQSGLWPAIIQRPYGVMASPQATPKAIFISAFSTAPLAADTEFTLGGNKKAFQAGVTALSKIAKVHVCVKDQSSVFSKLNDATVHTVTGKHPAGNVGIQIANISPVLKDETVWTVSPTLLCAIGMLFTKGKLDLSRKVAVCGPSALEPSYIEALPGVPMSCTREFTGDTEGIRIISGDILSGKNVGKNGCLGFFDDQITLVKEGTETELFGWAKPFRFNQFSATRSYFSRLLPNKKYDMDTNLHGGLRAFVMSDSFYADVLPMDIFPTYLIKACLAGDIDKMEKFGIYEVLPEDFALCEFIDPSKNNIQSIIQNGIDLMIKEMA